MLKNVKSSYFLKYIFSHITEGRKLKLIRYNKKLQKENDINIINYIYFSKRYLIIEPNGKGKEYDGYSDNLLFEGEYLNGKRNGKGIEFNIKGDIIFKGKYLNGLRILND